MQENLKIHFIPPVPKREKRVGIYCRVSTNSAEQIQSLTAQVSHLTRLTAAMPQWVLADVYMDIATSKTGSSRKEFNRLLEDCNSRKIEIVITKNISRFGRDTVEILDVLKQLRTLGVRVIFEQEELDTANTDSDLMISIIESLAQAENESRSDNIRWGIKQRAASGISKLYDRKCYGYKHDKDGKLVIDEQKAENVKLIFDLYLSGQSVTRNYQRVRKTENFFAYWERKVVLMLSNEKYTGDVRLLKFGKGEAQYLSSDNNPAIISKEVFEAVQVEKARRSNMIRSGNGTQRKSKKYSFKRK